MFRFRFRSKKNYQRKWENILYKLQEEKRKLYLLKKVTRTLNSFHLPLALFFFTSLLSFSLKIKLFKKKANYIVKLKWCNQSFLAPSSSYSFAFKRCSCPTRFTYLNDFIGLVERTLNQQTHDQYIYYKTNLFTSFSLFLIIFTLNFQFLRRSVLYIESTSLFHP